MLKRYQYLTKNGIAWTKWFPCNRLSDKPEVQIKHKKVTLLNEYK